MSLILQPITFKEACAFIRLHHRHHLPPQGYKFCVGVSDGERVVGCAITGRPVARGSDTGWTLEVTRCCTDGTPHAASMLYAACWRAAKALGYRRLITYILTEEKGTSLQAAGWKCLYTSPGGSWSCPSRPRVDTHPLQAKLCYEAPRGGEEGSN